MEHSELGIHVWVINVEQSYLHIYSINTQNTFMYLPDFSFCWKFVGSLLEVCWKFVGSSAFEFNKCESTWRFIIPKPKLRSHRVSHITANHRFILQTENICIKLFIFWLCRHVIVNLHPHFHRLYKYIITKVRNKLSKQMHQIKMPWMKTWKLRQFFEFNQNPSITKAVSFCFYILCL